MGWKIINYCNGNSRNGDTWSNYLRWSDSSWLLDPDIDIFAIEEAWGDYFGNRRTPESAHSKYSSLLKKSKFQEYTFIQCSAVENIENA